MNTARRHHYIPQWYLAGFTDTGTADGFITVHDLVEERDFKTKTHGVGIQRDFNRVEMEGLEPDILEKSWSQFEGDASQAVGRIIEAGNLGNMVDLSFLLNLVALLIVRNPKTRTLMNQSKEQILRSMGQMVFGNKDRFERLVKKARADGVDIPEEITFEQMQDFIQRDDYDIHIHRESSIQLELSLLDDIIRLLHKRRWSLFTPENPDSHFISGDHPVVLSWRDAEVNSPVGFGLTNTEVTFPINKRYMLVGIFEEDLDSFYKIPDTTVAFANSGRRSQAQRHVYSSGETYLYASR
jgi:hypothetical protein